MSSKFSLAGIVRGKVKEPDRIAIAGVQGIGKSSFAADAPSPIFSDVEQGTNELDVERLPDQDSFQGILDGIEFLRTEDHPYKTYVTDSLDAVEQSIWLKLCRANGWENIESPGYGKGYKIALGEWRAYLAALSRLRAERSMEIILIVHTHIKTFSNPLGDDYARNQWQLQDAATALISAWTDTNLFATDEIYVKKDSPKAKGKGIATGRRVIKTTRSAGWDAKNRYNLPPELPLSYAEYAAARAAGQPSDPRALSTEATELLDALRCDDAKRQQITEAITKNQNNPAQLARVVDRLRSLVAEQDKEAA